MAAQPPRIGSSAQKPERVCSYFHSSKPFGYARVTFIKQPETRINAWFLFFVFQKCPQKCPHCSAVRPSSGHSTAAQHLCSHHLNVSPSRLQDVQGHPLNQDDVPSLMHSSLPQRVGELGAGLPGLRATQGVGTGAGVETHLAALAAARRKAVPGSRAGCRQRARRGRDRS